MTASEATAWAESQIRELLALGVDLPDAQATVRWVLDNLPAGADPNTWVPDPALLDEPIDEAAIEDARIAYYAGDHVPARFKRLLDAREE